MAGRAPYRVVVSPAARRDLRKLPPDLQDAIRPLLLRLQDDPRPPGCRKLHGQEDTFRVRAGGYRIVYDVYDEERLVEVLRVLRRTETTYRHLR